MSQVQNPAAYTSESEVFDALAAGKIKRDQVEALMKAIRSNKADCRIFGWAKGAPGVEVKCQGKATNVYGSAVAGMSSLIKAVGREKACQIIEHLAGMEFETLVERKDDDGRVVIEDNKIQYDKVKVPLLNKNQIDNRAKDLVFEI